MLKEKTIFYNICVGSRFGGVSFTVDVSEPKPNRPNTMNLVEKRAQELGLCEDFVNGQAGSLGSKIVNGVVGGRVKVRPRASSEDEFFFSFSNTTQLELSGVFRIAVLLFVRSLWLYILLLPSSWPSICQLCRSPLECLFHSALPSACCELQWTVWHCSRVIPSLMRPDCQLQAFNAEVTSSFTIALSPCSHSYTPTLVPSFGDDGEGCGGWRIALSSQDTSSPRTWHSSAISPSSFGPSLVILGCFPSRLGPWAYYSKWTEAPRSFGPTICILK